MKYYLVVLISVFIISCGPKVDTQLTEEDIKELYTEILTHLRNQDVDALAQHFSDEAVIVLDMPVEAGGRQQLNLHEYKRQLNESWTMPAEFSYELLDMTMSIDGGGVSAVVKDVTRQKVSMNGRVVMSLKVKAVSKLELKNSEIKFTETYLEIMK